VLITQAAKPNSLGPLRAMYLSTGVKCSEAAPAAQGRAGAPLPSPRPDGYY
jgi:hypothetical protein